MWTFVAKYLGKCHQHDPELTSYPNGCSRSLPKKRKVSLQTLVAAVAAHLLTSQLVKAVFSPLVFRQQATRILDNLHAQFWLPENHFS